MIKSDGEVNTKILNSILYTSFYEYDYNYFLRYLSQVMKLCEIITNKHNDIESINENTDINNYFGLNDSIKLVNDFLLSINKEYSSRFLNILYEKNTYYGNFEEPTIDFLYDDIDVYYKDKSNDIDYDGKINIFMNDTILDSFAILHEVTHKFSLQYKQYNQVMGFYGEVPTILMELLFADYLKSKNICNENEINKVLIDRYMSAYYSSIDIMFENDIIKLYSQNDEIDNENIYDLALKYNEIYNFDINSTINNCFHNGVLTFPYQQRYVLGFLGAVDLYDKIKKDNNCIIDLFTIIENLGNSDYEIGNTVESLQKTNSSLLKKIRTWSLVNINKKQINNISDSLNNFIVK